MWRPSSLSHVSGSLYDREYLSLSASTLACRLGTGFQRVSIRFISTISGWIGANVLGRAPAVAQRWTQRWKGAADVTNMDIPLEVVGVLVFGAHLFLFATAYRSRKRRPSGLVFASAILGSAVLVLMNGMVALWGIVGLFLGGSRNFAALGVVGVAAIVALTWSLFELFESFNDEGAVAAT